jgi:hypothetical protein
MKNTLSVKAQILIGVAALCSCFATAHAQDARFTNNQHGISFQPPAGWKADPIAQYISPQRADGGAAMLSLFSEENALDISDNRIEALAREVREEISREGLEDAQIADRRKRAISGRDALQLDATYKVGDIQMRLRRVYIPVREQNRTYMFMFVDTAQQFEQSAATAEAAINSFALAGQPSSGAQASREPSGRRVPVLLLILLGVAALALMLGAGYMLMRRRANAH